MSFRLLRLHTLLNFSGFGLFSHLWFGVLRLL
jgi:hypothetical protein